MNEVALELIPEQPGRAFHGRKEHSSRCAEGQGPGNLEEDPGHRQALSSTPRSSGFTLWHLEAISSF